VLQRQALTDRIIGLGVEVHRTIGPGLLMNCHASRFKDGLPRFIV
jgi:hypothetical protein